MMLFKDSSDNRLITSLILMICTIAISVGCAIYLLYQVAFEQQKEALLTSVKSEKTLIEAVGRFDAINSRNQSNTDTLGHTLSQVADAQIKLYNKETSKAILLAEVNNNKLIPLILNDQRGIRLSGLYQLGGKGITTPHWALSIEPTFGKSERGTKGTNKLVVVFEKLIIGHHQLYLISKIDIAEIRGPFVKAIGVTTLIALLLSLISAWVITRQSNILISKIKQQNEYTQAILETSTTPIITINRHGLIQSFNSAAVKLFGYQPEAAVGQNVTMLIPDISTKAHDGFIQRYLNTGEKKIIGIGRYVIAKHHDGTNIPVHLGVGHRDLGNNEHLFVGFLVDMTKQKQEEQKLINAMETAKEATKVKSRFLANMSHEIRTPMNAILGFAELVELDATLSDTSMDYIKTISGSGKRLLHLINDILDFSKLEAGHLELETVCFHLPNLIKETIKPLNLSAKNKNISLVQTIASGVPKRVTGDPDRLNQIILNLVSNSVKFTKRGVIEIKVEQQPNSDDIQFSVIDTGIGMTPEQLKMCFEPFSQADSDIRRQYGGTGLGTVICKQIVEMMGGNISAKSEINRGTTFKFTVPLRATLIQSGCLYDDSESDNKNFSSPRSFNVLVAEDIKTNADLLILQLKLQGHRVTWVKNGQLAVAEADKGNYDIILMDIQMPVMDGIEASKCIRQSDSTRDIPIVAQTASVMTDEQDKCYEAGINSIILKPINFPKLFMIMDNLVPQGQGRQRHSGTPPDIQTADIDFSCVDAVIDTKQGLERWLQPPVYASSLIDFAKKHKYDANIIQKQLSEDPKQARFIVHSLRGLADNLAITTVAKLARETEELINQGKYKQLEVTITRLSDAIKTTTRAISRLKVTDDSNKMYRRQVSADDDLQPLAERFRQLISALEKLNPELAIPHLDQLEHYLPHREMLPIRQKLDNFDFRGAKEIVLKLARELAIRFENEDEDEDEDESNE